MSPLRKGMTVYRDPHYKALAYLSLPQNEKTRAFEEKFSSSIIITGANYGHPLLYIWNVPNVPKPRMFKPTALDLK